MFFRTRNIHTPCRLFICVRLLISVRRSLHLCECLWPRREYSHTSFACFMFVLAAWVFGGFVMFVGAFLERGVFTHLFRLCVVDSLLACMLASRRLWAPFFRTRNIHTPFRLFIVTVRHEPSRIVAVLANLATRLGSSRSANFFRGRCTPPEVHFRSPFPRHDFRCDGRDSR